MEANEKKRPWEKGPWNLSYNNCLAYAGHSSKFSVTFLRIFSPWIEDGWEQDDEQTLANMRLISKAPEMYELLAELVESDKEQPLSFWVSNEYVLKIKAVLAQCT